MNEKHIYEKDHFRIATEDHAKEGPLLWIKDSLDEAYLSFTQDELRDMLPVLVAWVGERKDENQRS